MPKQLNAFVGPFVHHQGIKNLLKLVIVTCLNVHTLRDRRKSFFFASQSYAKYLQCVNQGFFNGYKPTHMADFNILI
jgi:hypothetical protein